MAENDLDAYVRIVDAFKKSRAPPSFSQLLRAKRSTSSQEWMQAKGVSHEDIANASWHIFLLTLLPLSSLILIIAFALDLTLLSVLVPGTIASLLASALFYSYPERAAGQSDTGLLRDSPVLVGCLSMSLQLNPSLEQAVLFSTQRGSGPLFEKLRGHGWYASITKKSSASSILLSFAASLSDLNDSLRQALHLIIHASSERTREGMDRLLDKANFIALAGVKEAADRYVASLSVPTMVLFSLGILLPVMLFSLLPLTTIGGISLEETPADAGLDPMLVLLLVVIFPAASFAYAHSILLRNPMKDLPQFHFHPEGKMGAIVLFSLGASFACMMMGGVVGACATLIVAIFPSSVFLVLSTRKNHRAEKASPNMARDCISCLYQIGNRMISGSNLETAWEEIAKGKHDTALGRFCSSILYQHRLGGKHIHQLIKNDGRLKDVSDLIDGAYVTVAECAERDPQAAGRIALNMAQYLSDMRTCEVGIEDRLKGVVDMMRSTSLLFGPIVFGITCGLFGLLYLSDSEAVAGQLLLIVGGYLMELSFMVCYFTVFLQGRRSWKEVAYQIGTRAPVSILVFILVFTLARMGLSSLL